MRKRALVVVIAVVTLGGAYAAGAITHPAGITRVSGHRLRGLLEVSNSDPQTVAVPDPPHSALVPGAQITLNSLSGEQGVFDVRFSGWSGMSDPLITVDVLVDGVAVAPVGKIGIGGPTFSIERVVGPLSATKHVVTIAVSNHDTTAPSPPIQFDGWTLVVEHVEARPQ